MIPTCLTATPAGRNEEGRRTARRLAFDSETFLVRPGLAVPRMVCGQFGAPPTRTEYPHSFGTVASRVLKADEACAELHRLLDDPNTHFIGQFIAFDWAVACNHDSTLLPKVFRAYDDNRIEDIAIRDKLIALALGQLADAGEQGAKAKERYNLDAIVQRRFGVSITHTKYGPDTWRLRYCELEPIPVDEWPEAARVYAEDDVRWPHAIYEHQEVQAGGPIPDSHAQARSDFWMYLMRAWGVRTDRGPVDELEASLRKDMAWMDAVLKEAGVLTSKIVKGREKWTKKMAVVQDMIVRNSEGPVKHTPTGKVRTKREDVISVLDPEVLAWIEGHIPEGFTARQSAEAAATYFPDYSAEQLFEGLVLHAVGERSAVEKVLGTYIPALRAGTMVPINPAWNVLVATGRTSARAPNLQNPPRKGGVRECFIPRRGWYFIDADYSFIELVTLAQTCIDLFGWSKLADAINAGLDPHLDIAAEILGLSYEMALARYQAGDPEIKEARQKAKSLNFGYPGGLGAKTMVVYARQNYGVKMTLEQAVEFKEMWCRKYPEMRLYFRVAAQATANGTTAKFVQFISGRNRGDCSYTQYLNTAFQGRAADGAKNAGWLIAKECYLPTDTVYPTVEARRVAGLPDTGDSPLYGCRTVIFAHDEFILEAPIPQAPRAALRLAEVMVLGMKPYTKDVRTVAAPVMVDRWRKGADPVYDADGLPVLWVPKRKAA
jgi:hypothetical protein